MQPVPVVAVKVSQYNIFGLHRFKFDYTDVWIRQRCNCFIIGVIAFIICGIVLYLSVQSNYNLMNSVAKRTTVPSLIRKVVANIHHDTFTFLTFLVLVVWVFLFFLILITKWKRATSFLKTKVFASIWIWSCSFFLQVLS